MAHPGAAASRSRERRTWLRVRAPDPRRSDERAGDPMATQENIVSFLVAKHDYDIGNVRVEIDV